MAQFRAEIRGDRGIASRQGNKKSGISSHTHGWHLGCRVFMDYDQATDEDRIRITLTGGSGYGEPNTLAVLFEGTRTQAEALKLLAQAAPTG